jgi:hypothetical protein
MKYRLLVLMLIVSVSTAFAQKQTIIAKFIISDARFNGEDVTPTFLADGGYFVFYTINGDKEIYFGNIRTKSDSQSFGPTYNMEHTSTPETTKDYASDTFSFNWSYTNTYDSKKGTAKVRLVKIKKPVGIAFRLTMIAENLDVIDYKGYMEGSLKTLE